MYQTRHLKYKDYQTGLKKHELFTSDIPQPQKLYDKITNQEKGDEWFWFKMVVQEDATLTLIHQIHSDNMVNFLWEKKTTLTNQLDQTFALQGSQKKKERGRKMEENG